MELAVSALVSEVLEGTQVVTVVAVVVPVAVSVVVVVLPVPITSDPAAGSSAEEAAFSAFVWPCKPQGSTGIHSVLQYQENLANPSRYNQTSVFRGKLQRLSQFV